MHLSGSQRERYGLSVTATLSAEVAAALGLSAVGDEAYLEVSKVNDDGTVEVLSELEDEGEGDGTTPMPEVETAKKALKAKPMAAPPVSD